MAGSIKTSQTPKLKGRTVAELLMTYFFGNRVMHSLSPSWSRRCSTTREFWANGDRQFLLNQGGLRNLECHNQSKSSKSRIK